MSLTRQLTCFQALLGQVQALLGQEKVLSLVPISRLVAERVVAALGVGEAEETAGKAKLPHEQPSLWKVGLAAAAAAEAHVQAAKSRLLRKQQQEECPWADLAAVSSAVAAASARSAATAASAGVAAAAGERLAAAPVADVQTSPVAA